MSNINQCSKCRNCADIANCQFYSRENDSPCSHYIKPIDNSKFMQRIFLWTGRIGRIEYLCTVLLAVVLYLMLLMLGFIFGWLPRYISPTFLALLLMLPSLYISIVAGFKRCNDTNASYWWAFAPLLFVFFSGLIPIILGALPTIYLFFVKGEDDINEHGTIPLKNYSSQIDPENFN